MREWENNIRKVEPYVPGEQPKQDNVIKLNTNENPYPPTPMVTDAAGVEVMQEIRSTGKLEQETEQKLRSVLDTYTENFLNTRPEK